MAGGRTEPGESCFSWGPSGRKKNGARRKLLQLGAQWQEEERSQEKAASAKHRSYERDNFKLEDDASS